MIMNNNTANMNWRDAVEAACSYIDADAEELRILAVRLSGGYWEISARSDWMKYNFYVSCATGEIDGFDSVPDTDGDELDGISCALLLSGCEAAA